MKAELYSTDGKSTKKIDLPSQFIEPVRPDIIKRAVLAVQSSRIAPYGAYSEAGKRHSSIISKRRRDYKTTYGKGISRTPRKVMTKRGSQFSWRGATVPFTVGGRRAHPPKPGKIHNIKVNSKERKKAIRSALAATLDIDLVRKRGHRINNLVPVIDSKIENISKTSEVKKILLSLNLKEELSRTQQKKIRAGRGKSRGRKYKTKIGPLIVVSKACSLEKASYNIPGLEVCRITNLNAEKLAPGTVPGRFTIFTESSLKVMHDKKLFLDNKKKIGKK